MGTYYATKNYNDRNGNRFNVGGEVRFKAGGKMVFEAGATVEGLKLSELDAPAALYMAEIGSDASSVALLRERVNHLVTLLKTAGLMASVVPTISVTAQPADLELVAGAIDSGDVVTAAFEVSDGSTPTLQWYSNTTDTNTGGSAISGATAASYAIPTGTTAGTYYYYCVANHEGVTQASDPVTVVVAAA